MDCTGCELPLSDTESMNAGSPPLCSFCEENRCAWCGEFVAPSDLVKDSSGTCHKSCHQEMYDEDDDFVKFDLENPDDGEYAGLPNDDDLPF